MFDLFIDQLFANTALNNQDDMPHEENDTQENTVESNDTIFVNTLIDE